MADKEGSETYIERAERSGKGVREAYRIPEGEYSVLRLIEEMLPEERIDDLPMDFTNTFPVEGDYDLQILPREFTKAHGLGVKTPTALLSWDQQEDGSVCPVLRMKVATQEEMSGKQVLAMVEVTFDPGSFVEGRLSGSISRFVTREITRRSVHVSDWMNVVEENQGTAYCFLRERHSIVPVAISRAPQQEIPVDPLIIREELERQRVAQIENINRAIYPANLYKLEALYWRSLREVGHIVSNNQFDDEAATETIHLMFDPFDLIYDVAKEWGIDPYNFFTQSRAPLLSTYGSESSALLSAFLDDKMTIYEDKIHWNLASKPLGVHLLETADHRNTAPTHDKCVHHILRAAQVSHAAHRIYRYRFATNEVPHAFTDMVNQQLYYRFLYSMFRDSGVEGRNYPYTTLLYRKARANEEMLNAVLKGEVKLEDVVDLTTRIEALDLDRNLDLLLETSRANAISLEASQIILSQIGNFNTLDTFIDLPKEASLNSIIYRLKRVKTMLSKLETGDRASDTPPGALGKILILMGLYLGGEDDAPEMGIARKAALAAILAKYSDEVELLVLAADEMLADQVISVDWRFGDIH